MERKELGKIENVRFGLGGYQDAMLGITFTLEGKGWGTVDFRGTWDPQGIEVTKHTQWTEEDRSKSFADTVRFISKLLSEAKVRDVNKLAGIPVEVTFENNTLKEWRILTEVL